MNKYFEKFKLKKEKYSFKNKKEHREYFHDLALEDPRKYREHLYKEHEEKSDVAESRRVYLLNGSYLILGISVFQGMINLTLASLIALGFSILLMILSIHYAKLKLKIQESYFIVKYIYDCDDNLDIAVELANEYYLKKHKTNNLKVKNRNQ